MATRARYPLEVVERETGGIQRANEIRRKVFAGFRAGGTRLPNGVRASLLHMTPPTGSIPVRGLSRCSTIHARS